MKSEKYNGEKIGRLKFSIAKSLKIRCADIYLSKDAIKHVAEKHAKELASLGFEAETYIKLIVNGFNQVRQGTGQSFLLVIFNENKTTQQTAAIALNFCQEKGVWEITTAQPRRTSEILKKKLLWKK